MKTLLYFLLAVLAASLLVFRIAPIDRDVWHVDPADFDDPERPGVRLIGLDAPRYRSDPETVLSTFKEIALAEPRTRLFEGSIDEGMLTFVSRSRVFGFPDLITVKAVDEGVETKLSIAGRPRYGGSDWGVNAARLDRWLQDMRLRLGQR